MRGVGTPEISTCKYKGARLWVRGPRRSLDAPFVACLGGTETFGKYVQSPFADELETALGKTCVNFGSLNAGLDALVMDENLLALSSKADVVVLQLLGAQNLTNPFYRVHPRRNDRFLEATQLLRQTYPEVDFTEFSFNRHLLTKLNAVCPKRFNVIRKTLQDLWRARMRLLLAALDTDVVLLWLRYTDQRAPAPDLITQKVTSTLAGYVRAIVEVPIKTAGSARELSDMHFDPMSAGSASRLPGPSAHRRIATRLCEVLTPMT